MTRPVDPPADPDPMEVPARPHHRGPPHDAKTFAHHLAAAHHHAASHPAAATAPSPAATTEVLKTAMAKEAVPASWESSLRYIVDHESGGRVGVSNGVDTARGLFQLTAAQYHLNPHGAASFGNAVEEAQGGIRYIQKRYQTADAAAAFWQRHKWY